MNLLEEAYKKLEQEREDLLKLNRSKYDSNLYTRSEQVKKSIAFYLGVDPASISLTPGGGSRDEGISPSGFYSTIDGINFYYNATDNVLYAKTKSGEYMRMAKLSDLALINDRYGLEITQPEAPVQVEISHGEDLTPGA